MQQDFHLSSPQRFMLPATGKAHGGGDGMTARARTYYYMYARGERGDVVSKVVISWTPTARHVTF